MIENNKIINKLMILYFLKKIIKFIIFYPRYLIFKLSGKPDEIVTIIDGGLGSQMSQYAMGQEIQRLTGFQVSYDLSWYKNNGKDINGKENRLFELDKYFPNVNIRKASNNMCKIYNILFNKKNNKILIQNLDNIKLNAPSYLGGYYKSDKYSNYNQDYLKNIYSFNLSLNNENKEMLNNILHRKISVGIQVRLGDYIGSALNVVTYDYFNNSVKFILNKIRYNDLTDIYFFIFSDNSIKAKEYLPILDNYTFININDNDHGIYDMYLMKHCHHFIISNSTFGFWSALLSDRADDKIVIQPDKWLKTDTERLKPKYPGWVTIEC